MKTSNTVLLTLLFLCSLSCKKDAKQPTLINTASETSNIAKVEKVTVLYGHEIVVPDLRIPWGFVFLPDASLLITEKRGNLIHYQNGMATAIEGLPDIKVLGQGGLLDIELHPNYVENGWIYISYASSEGTGPGANTALMRCKLTGNTLTDKQVLYKASPNSRRGQHFGSRIEFDNEGFLYFSIGDRGNRDINPQNIERDCGKVYRLHDDGRIPASNPFVRNRNAKKGIYC